MKNDHRPVIPDSVRLPEITVKAIVLSIVLAAVLAAANAYLGLFAGMTVSASIPAAVASMAILRLFRRSNILENNIVQTAASSGEALAAGVIFTIPALILVGQLVRLRVLANDRDCGGWRHSRRALHHSSATCLDCHGPIEVSRRRGDRRSPESRLG